MGRDFGAKQSSVIAVKRRSPSNNFKTSDFTLRIQNFSVDVHQAPGQAGVSVAVDDRVFIPSDFPLVVKN